MLNHIVKWIALPAALIWSMTAFGQSEFPLVGELSGGGVVRIAPVGGSLVVGEASDWNMVIEIPGEAEIASLLFEAAMPDHGHGLPQPARVIATREDTTYRVEDVLFNMDGRWVITVWLGRREAIESVTFDLILNGGGKLEDGLAGFTPNEVAVLKSLALSEEQASRPDPTNRLSGNPDAAQLGEALFFEKGMSATGQVSCATCHEPVLAFTDGRAVSVGSKSLTRNAPSLLGLARARWFYWDGRRDSLWAQALTPLESPGEMDTTRTAVVRYVTSSAEYREHFARLSGVGSSFSDPHRYPDEAGPFATSSSGRALWAEMSFDDRGNIDSAFVAIGKILAAYVETLDHPMTRFDEWVRTLDTGEDERAAVLISASERRGAKLFLDSGRTHCLRCHNGRSLTNHGFHAIGSQGHSLDLGRQFGLDAARVDPFNCTGIHSDARGQCGLTALAGVMASEFAGAFKVPSLRNLTVTAPYFHDGRFATVEEVLAFYLQPPGPEAGNHEAPPLDLKGDEVVDLIAFLEMLSAEPTAYSSMAR